MMGQVLFASDADNFRSPIHTPTIRSALISIVFEGLSGDAEHLAIL
jgi:hypothetical protein